MCLCCNFQLSEWNSVCAVSLVNDKITYRLFFGTNSETANASSCQPCKKVCGGGFDLQSIGMVSACDLKIKLKMQSASVPSDLNENIDLTLK